eukprot:3144487-Alexandrium_andersonii.AAC.1
MRSTEAHRNPSSEPPRSGCRAWCDSVLTGRGAPSCRVQNIFFTVWGPTVLTDTIAAEERLRRLG